MTRQGKGSGYASPLYIMQAMNILLWLLAAEVLDRATSTKSTALIWASAGLLAVLTGLFLWAKKRAAKSHGERRFADPLPEIHVRNAKWLLVSITLLAASLRFYQLGTESLWYDETWTLHSANLPWAEILQGINALPIAAAKLLLEAGRSEYVLRVAPALAGVLTVPVVYRLGRTLYGRREGLIAALLFSISGYSIYHSQELRFYAWQMLFSSLSLYFLLHGLRRDRVRDWLGFSVSTALNLYSQPFGLFVLAGEGVYVAVVLVQESVRSPEPDTKPWSHRLQAWSRRALGPGIAAVAALLAYPHLWGRLVRFYNPRWVIDLPTEQAQSLFPLEARWLTDPISAWIHGLFAAFTGTTGQPILLYAMLGLLLLGVLSSAKRTVILSLIWVLLPLPMILLMRIKIYERYFSYFLPVILILISRGVVHLAAALSRQTKRRKTALLVLTALVAAPSLVGLSGYYPGIQKPQWRELTAFVDAQHQPGDRVIVTSFFRLAPLPFEWYTTTSAEELPRGLFPGSGVWTDLGQIEDLPKMTRDQKRIWLIAAYQKPEIMELILDTMESTHNRVGEWNFVGLRLLLFEAAPKESKS